MEFGINDLTNLKNLLCEDDNTEYEKNNYKFGSTLNPSTIHNQKKTEVASPNAKIEVKVNNRDAKIENEMKSPSKTPVKTGSSKAIWNEEELKKKQYKAVKDDRLQPDFDVLYKQKVGTEDVFLGLSGKDPSSIHCNCLLIKIKLPKTKLNEITLDVKSQSFNIQAPLYFLNHILPYPVEKDKGNADWDAKNETLLVTLPIIKKSLID